MILYELCNMKIHKHLIFHNLWRFFEVLLLEDLTFSYTELQSVIK